MVFRVTYYKLDFWITITNMYIDYGMYHGHNIELIFTFKTMGLNHVYTFIHQPTIHDIKVTVFLLDQRCCAFERFPT